MCINSSYTHMHTPHTYSYLNNNNVKLQYVRTLFGSLHSRQLLITLTLLKQKHFWNITHVVLSVFTFRRASVIFQILCEVIFCSISAFLLWCKMTLKLKKLTSIVWVQYFNWTKYIPNIKDSVNSWRQKNNNKQVNKSLVK